MPRVAGIVGELAGIAHSKNEIDLCPHKREPLGRLPLLEADAPVRPNRRDLVVVHQWALRAAMSRIARWPRLLPTAESSAGP
jgi:hypothetical protein